MSKRSGGFRMLTAGLCLNYRSKTWARIESEGKEALLEGEFESSPK